MSFALHRRYHCASAVPVRWSFVHGHSEALRVVFDLIMIRLQYWFLWRLNICDTRSSASEKDVREKLDAHNYDASLLHSIFLHVLLNKTPRFLLKIFLIIFLSRLVTKTRWIEKIIQRPLTIGRFHITSRDYPRGGFARNRESGPRSSSPADFSVISSPSRSYGSVTAPNWRMPASSSRMTPSPTHGIRWSEDDNECSTQIIPNWSESRSPTFRHRNEKSRIMRHMWMMLIYFWCWWKLRGIVLQSQCIWRSEFSWTTSEQLWEEAGK
jgi:hypothetical protein